MSALMSVVTPVANFSCAKIFHSNKFSTTLSQGVNDKVALTDETFVLELIYFGVNPSSLRLLLTSIS